MAGYTPIATCNSKYDDLHASGFLIESEVLEGVKRYLLLITMDVALIPLTVSEYFKEKISDHYPIYPGQILIHATHTHKGFDMAGSFSRGGNWPGLIKGIICGATKKDDLYKVWIGKQFVRMVGQMMAELQPAKIAWKRIIPTEHFTVNRRRHELSPQPFGVICFKSLATNELIGFLMNMGAHPTTLGHQNKQMSADYPGRAVHIVEQITDGKIKTAYFNGPAGDIAPYYAAGGFHFRSKTKDGKIVRKKLYSFTRFYGYLLGKKGLEIAQSITDSEYRDQITFKSYARTFWVPMKDYKRHRVGGKSIWVYINNRIVHIAKRYLLFPLALAMGDSHEPNFPGFAVKHDKSKSVLRTTINVYTKVQYMAIEACNKANPQTSKRSLAIIGVPGELFEDMAKKMALNTPAGIDNTFIFQAANDWIAYLFPLKLYVEQGGYEPLASFAPLCGAYVLNNYLQLLREIKGNLPLGYY
jgi:hypothetical protein